MSARCLNCDLTRYKLNELMLQYEQLLKTKEQQIICSHRIIAQLQDQLRQAKQALLSSGTFAKQLQKNSHKIMLQQQQTIEYLKQREIKLVDQLKNTQKQIFKLVINTQDFQQAVREQLKSQPIHSIPQNQNKDFITPKKGAGVGISNSGNITLNKQRQNSSAFQKLLQQSTIRVTASDSKDTLRLKVTQDKLQLMNIKYKMALLKTVEIATLR